MPKAADRTLVPGTISRQRAVPGSIARPEYVGRPAPAQHVGGDKYDDETIGRIRAASKLAAQALELVLSEAPGPIRRHLAIGDTRSRCAPL